MQSVDSTFTHLTKEITMNKRLIISLAVLSTVSMTALPVLAQDAAPHAKHSMKHHDTGINHRQNKQGERIHQGVRSGELTRAEAKDLREDRKDISKKEHEYKSDGHLSKAERQDLHKDMNALSKDIHTAKHDTDKRPRAK